MKIVGSQNVTYRHPDNKKSGREREACDISQVEMSLYPLLIIIYSSLISSLFFFCKHRPLINRSIPVSHLSCFGTDLNVFVLNLLISVILIDDSTMCKETFFYQELKLEWQCKTLALKIKLL